MIDVFEIDSPALQLSIAFNDKITRATFGTLFVTHARDEIVSPNYATKYIASSGSLSLLSRNSPSLNAGGRIFIHGAFKENNPKPYVFYIDLLRYAYPMGGSHWTNSFIQDLDNLEQIMKDMFPE